MTTLNKTLISIVIILILSTISFSYLYTQMKQRSDRFEERLESGFVTSVYDQNKHLSDVIHYIHSAEELDPVTLISLINRVEKKINRANINASLLLNYPKPFEEQSTLTTIEQTNVEFSRFISQIPRYYETQEPFEHLCDGIDFSSDEEVMNELQDYYEVYLFYLDEREQETALLGNDYQALLEHWESNHELLCMNR